MRVVFLGTNGWYDTQTGSTISVLIQTEHEDIVLDAGSGFFRLDEYIDGTKPVYLLLSHFHLDHIIGLHGLVKMKFNEGLCIAGQRGTQKILGDVIASPFTFPLNELPYKTELIDLDSGMDRIPFGLEYLPLVHSDPCLGYRITRDDKVIAFCTDTGYCENAVKLASECDLIITECALKSGQYNEAWPHLNPEEAAGIALEAGAGRLVLTHFDARNYLTVQERIDAETAARKIFPETYASYDGMELIV